MNTRRQNAFALAQKAQQLLSKAEQAFFQAHLELVGQTEILSVSRSAAYRKLSDLLFTLRLESSMLGRFDAERIIRNSNDVVRTMTVANDVFDATCTARS